VVAVGSEDGGAYLWHRERCELLRVLRGHASAVTQVDWSPTRRAVCATASDDRTVRLWAR
jgi:WD40 repeat protein